MDIESVVISCDNSHYKDFYDINLKIWSHFKIGLDCFYVDDEKSTKKNSFVKVNDISTALQSQIARLYGIKQINNTNVLISDIDMIPININYFKDTAKELKDDEIMFYSGQPYGVNNYFPMCYVLGKSEILTDLFQLCKFESFEEFVLCLHKKYNGDWNTDEHYVYDCVKAYNKDKIVIKTDREFSRRIDRSNWTWQLELLKSGYYIDSHLLRPYKDYKQPIDQLVDQILNIKM